MSRLPNWPVLSVAALMTALPASAQVASEPPKSSTAAAESPDTLDARLLTYGFIDKAIADGRIKPAAELILRARVRFPGPEISLREAELMLAHGSIPEAAMAFQSLEADPVVGARALVGRGIAAIRAGEDDAADKLLEAGLVRDPSLARAWSARGVLADRRRDWPAADAFYQRALDTAPTVADYRSNRGYSRLLRGQHAAAEADFVKALELKPGLKAAITNLTLARAMQGRYAEAFNTSNREDLARELNTVGVAAMLRGDNRIAESYFSRAIEMNSRFDKTASANLAYLKSVAPELDQSLETPGQ
ncbi:MAG: tetratricopeptide repeat protein [Sandaracinobacteroides sp.]